MIPEDSSQILAIGKASTALVRVLTAKSRQLVLVDPDPTKLQEVKTKLPKLTCIGADVQKLPFDSGRFQAVVSTGPTSECCEPDALYEIARVLSPNGQFVSHNIARDDTVPWVRRLGAIIRRVDPTAMSAQDSMERLNSVASNPYFKKLQTKQFRLWIPILITDLLKQINANPKVREMDELHRTKLNAEVSDLYNGIVRGNTLMLPYQITCARAAVNAFGSRPKKPKNEAGFSISFG